jgi:hypothetical protein
MVSSTERFWSDFRAFCNTHGYTRDPPDDRDVTRIANPSGVSM